MDEDYDIYGGAPWSAYHDDVDDAYWQEHEREVALPGFSDLADADRRFFEQQERAEEFYLTPDEYEQVRPYENSDEILHGLGDLDGGSDA